MEKQDEKPEHRITEPLAIPRRITFTVTIPPKYRPSQKRTFSSMSPVVDDRPKSYSEAIRSGSNSYCMDDEL